MSLQAKTDDFAKSLFLHEYVTEIQENRAESVELGVPQGSVFVSGKINDETIKHYVEKRSSVHETQIKEIEKTKRTTLVVSAVIFIAAAILVVFSPQDKEVVTYSIAGSMLLLASGIAGYGILRIKTNRFSAEASQGSHK